MPCGKCIMISVQLSFAFGERCLIHTTCFSCKSMRIVFCCLYCPMSDLSGSNMTHVHNLIMYTHSNLLTGVWKQGIPPIYGYGMMPNQWFSMAFPSCSGTKPSIITASASPQWLQVENANYNHDHKLYPPVNYQFALEHGHLVAWFSHSKWWCSMVL